MYTMSCLRLRFTFWDSLFPSLPQPFFLDFQLPPWHLFICFLPGSLSATWPFNAKLGPRPPSPLTLYSFIKQSHPRPWFPFLFVYQCFHVCSFRKGRGAHGAAREEGVHLPHQSDQLTPRWWTKGPQMSLPNCSHIWIRSLSMIWKARGQIMLEEVDSCYDFTEKNEARTSYWETGCGSSSRADWYPGCP